MAKHHGVYKCGHEGTFEVNYTNRHRYDSQDKIDKHFTERVCRECYKKQIVEEREKAAKIEIERAKETELPELIGTEKQINWAVAIRKDMLDNWNRIFEESVSIKPIDILLDLKKYASAWVEGVEGHTIAEELKNIIRNSSKSDKEDLAKDLVFGALSSINKAKIFIDLETSLSTFELFNSIIYSQYKRIRKTTVDIKEDVVIMPVGELKDEKIVSVYSNGNKLYCEFHINNELKDICKANGYSWNSNKVAWYRVINENINGNIKDRKIEIANKILSLGYPVKLDEEELKNKILNADYKIEHKRWIGVYENNFVIIFEHNKEIYNDFKSIQGSQWHRDFKCLLTPLESTNNIVIKADKYNFKFTEKAIKTIENIDKAFANRFNVKEVDEQKHISLEEELEELLDSNAIILPDLED